jgi:hypothetical protein
LTKSFTCQVSSTYILLTPDSVLGHNTPINKWKVEILPLIWTLKKVLKPGRSKFITKLQWIISCSGNLRQIFSLNIFTYFKKHTHTGMQRHTTWAWQNRYGNIKPRSKYYYMQEGPISVILWSVHWTQWSHSRVQSSFTAELWDCVIIGF